MSSTPVPDDGLSHLSRGEFRELFAELVGSSSDDNDVMIKIRGFQMFAWLPIFWPHIYNFPIDPADVIIATFPKCGTTWMQHMVHLIVTEDFETGNEVPIDVRVPFMEFPKPAAPATLKAQIDKQPPRLLKTHLPTCLLPKDAAKAKIICVYRNAKDCCVSFYHHYELMHPKDRQFPWTFDEFARRFMDGNVLFAPYPEHLKGYLEYKKAGNSIIMLRYEDMKNDARKVIRQVADYLGKKLNDETIERIFEATKFEKMQTNDATTYKSDRTNEKEGKQFIRKGIVGDWKNHFNDPELLKNFNEWIEENLPEELIFRD